MVVRKIRDAAEISAPGPIGQPGSVGLRLRELRKAQRLTLQQLGAVAGVSVGYLSEIERDITRVPIGVLSRLAEALGVHLHWFFQGGAEADADDRDVIVRAGTGRRLTFPGIGIADELLSPDLLGPLEVVRSTLAPGADSEFYSHDGHEVGVILTGVLELWIADRRFRLVPGDTFAFNSTKPHRCANTTDEPTVVLWIVTPPHY